jgi:DNA-binding Lrp family transcriptional regulator
MNLDLKDRKILYQLDLNARQSVTQIGKKVGLSKQMTSYRIQKLEDKGIIKNYYTFIDGIRLGNNVLRLYITFQYMTSERLKEIIEYFVRKKSVVVVYSLQGRYDFEVVFWIKDLNSYYKFWQETLKKYGDYFQNQTLSLYIEYITYKLSYLLSDYQKINHRKNVDIMGGKKPLEVDNIDIKILKIISLDARIPLINIANELKMSSDGVKYRLNKLINLKIIKNFRANIDYTKLGYKYYKLDLFLKDYNKRSKIINYICKNPYLYAIDVTTGLSHLELEFIVKNFEMLNSIMDDINKNFQNSLRNYQYLIFKNTHKYSFFN